MSSPLMLRHPRQKWERILLLLSISMLLLMDSLLCYGCVVSCCENKTYLYLWRLSWVFSMNFLIPPFVIHCLSCIHSSKLFWPFYSSPSVCMANANLLFKHIKASFMYITHVNTIYIFIIHSLSCHFSKMPYNDWFHLHKWNDSLLFFVINSNIKIIFPMFFKNN